MDKNFPCLSCITRPICCGRARKALEEDGNYDSAVDVLFEICQVIGDYLPYDYVYGASEFQHDTICNPDDSGISDETWEDRMKTFFEVFVG